MQRNFILAGLLAFGMAGSAFAQASCPCAGGTFQPRASIVTLLGSKTVCAVLGNEVWQEVHTGTTAAGGQLSDLKGTASPQEVVGSWSVVGTGANSRVRYNYGTGGTYDYAVCLEGGSTVHFCGANFGGRNITNARVINGGAC